MNKIRISSPNILNLTKKCYFGTEALRQAQGDSGGGYREAGAAMVVPMFVILRERSETKDGRARYLLY